MTDWQRALLGLLVAALLVCWGCLVFVMVYPRDGPAGAARAAGRVGDLTSAPPYHPELPPTWTLTGVASLPATRLPIRTPTADSAGPTPPARPTPANALTPTFVHPSSDLPIPSPVPALELPDGAVTILLLGSDRRPDWDNWRTDAVHYVVVHPDAEHPSVSLLSVPRDLYVYIPGFWLSRINFADLYGTTYRYDGGGFGLLNQTLLHNLGISADYYVKIDFDGLIGLVDLLGGIDVPVHCSLTDYWPYPDADGTYHQITLAPGMQHLDGELALWYARSRRTTSVFAREWRQQQVLEAMWLKGRSADLLETVPALYERTRHLFETNLPLDQILALALAAARLDTADVRLYNLGRAQVSPYTTPYGGAVLLPLWEQIEPVLTEVLRVPATNRAAQDPAVVEVWNGTRQADWDLLAADRLQRQGFRPVIGVPDRRDYPRTQIVTRDGERKSGRVPALQALLGVPDEDVLVGPTGDRPATIRLVIGQNYVPCW